MTIRPPGRTIFEEISEMAMAVSVLAPAPSAVVSGSIPEHGDGKMKSGLP